MNRKVQLPKIQIDCSKKLNNDEEDDDDNDLRPVSPLGEYLSSSILSLCVLGVLEFEIPIDFDLETTARLVKDVFLPINPRFSSVMVKDKNGGKQWKKVEVNIEDHIKTVVLPSGMSSQFYDEHFNEYIGKITTEPLSENKPLWEIHMIKYPTSNAAGTIIFKLHHALGDGYSLMGALLSCLQRAENPSLPLTFPSVKLRSNDKKDTISRKTLSFLWTMFNTVADFTWSVLKSSVIEDDISPIRSGDPDFKAMSIATTEFCLGNIKRMKANLGVTVNDVITGIIFLGTRLYMEEKSKGSSVAHSTSLVLLNTRMFRDYKSVEEMAKPSVESAWGNKFTFLNVSIPKLDDVGISNPISFVEKVHHVISRKRSSFAIYLMAWFLEAVKKIGGTEVATNFVHSTLKNPSVGITNMIGPIEQMALSNHPVKGFYFMIAGAPHNVVITIVSYMEKLRVGVGGDKGFIDVESLKSCIEKAFQMMHKASSQI